MRLFRIATSLALLALGIASAGAETYPARPIKIIVSTSAGGITDVVARVLGKYITAKTGQAVVIDNRAGAGGNIAMDAVAKAAPDGYTLGVANTGNIVINPYLYRSMPYDPLADLVPVGSMGEVPLFMVVNGKMPPKDLKEFVAYAKARSRSATARPASGRRRTWRRTHSTGGPASTWCTCPIAAPPPPPWTCSAASSR